ncbi:lactate dehydrogenase [Fructilactobacillus sp. Tb1]|uniref:lactate dehydrogenase n=1 Tax=Fructilactobacillus sp. Tb1 TaxID=3422304 RepID=UPI003D27E867
MRSVTILKSKIIIKGEQRRISNLLRAMLVQDTPVTILLDDPEIYAEEILAIEMCHNFRVELMEADAKLDNVDGMIYLPNDEFYAPEVTDAALVADRIREPLMNFRITINDIISRGFNGKIIIDSPHDEVFVYFAAYFSGLDVKKIIGLGTLPQEIILREALVREFKVSGDDINVNTLGLNTHNLVAWSRVYIGPSTLLSYIADDSQNYDDEIINNLSEEIGNHKIVSNPIIQSKAIIRLLTCVYGENSLICSVISLKKENDKLHLSLGPKLVNQFGVFRSINLQLADNELQELTDDGEWSMNIIENIKKGKKNGKKN